MCILPGPVGDNIRHLVLKVLLNIPVALLQAVCVCVHNLPKTFDCLPQELKQKQENNVIAGSKAGIINVMKIGDTK